MDILKVILEKAKITWYLLLRYLCVAWAWCFKTINIRIQKMKQAGTDRKMEKVYSELGKTVFQLYQEGQQNLLESATVQEQLSQIQQQLGKKNMLEDKIKQIEETYKQKVTNAKEKYERRKTGGSSTDIGAEETEQETQQTGEDKGSADSNSQN